MKYRDFRAIEELFGKKVKDTSDVETFFKVYKAIKKFEGKEKTEKEKTDKKKDEPKTWWHQASVIQKVTVLCAIVPFIAAIELSPFVFLFLITIKALR